ncbi:sensor histidine kinase [Streptomyces indicus]|uniref:histidine kinase n=1 Tax=Streptomyces indicus TaxID=417292 RepID=A0A1G8TJP4_9ACTN|nr:sensor histidine kinase [Streptomyces indicus]SDJ41683.1 Signal transduction histidine kinase [Streptomyces indicus]
MRTPRNTPGSPGPTGPDAATAPPVRGRRAHAGPPADEQPDEGPTAQADIPTPPERGPIWQLRPRRVRAKIVCLLMVPVVSLIALWAYATVTTAQDVSRLSQLQRVDEQVRTPVAAAVAELQDERAAAVAYAARPDNARADALRNQAGQTDKAIGELRLGEKHTVADGADFPAGVAERLGAFVSDADRLVGLRTTVLDRRTGWDEAYDQYTETIGKAFAVGGALTGVQDAELGSDARVVLDFSRAGEMLARENALLSTAQLTNTLDGKRLQSFVGTVETRRILLDNVVEDLRGEERTAWRDLEKGSAYADVLSVEDKVLAAPAGRKAAESVDAGVWDKAYTEIQDDLRAIETDAGQRAADRADPFTRGILTPAGAAVLLGLLAVAASLVISVRIGRALVVELVSLRNSALEIARRKLPSAMRRLRAGDEIDIRAEAPPGPPAEDEIGQVSEALGTVHRAALSAAIERAELASGISGVFVNLARRSQVLVHRQLNLLDSMERRAEDPNELSDLFRLDHLTTRMRRHAESLIILSGAAPGRAWRMPVSLTNVVRAAVSEVEDYARVEVRQLPETAVIGAAVADLTHMLAELVENAAQFSPPHTKVRVSGEPVGNGYALEVEDRGLGMGKERLAEANRRIEQSEALDLFDSDRLGLFVVSRLAARHGIKVHLRTSPYGGTTAVVLLPTALLQDALPKGNGRAAPDEIEPAAEHTRVPGAGPVREVGVSPVREVGGGNSLPGPRPALAAMPDPPAPRGVTTLRLHTRSSEEQRAPQREAAPTQPSTNGDATPSADLPRRVRQASLAPQLREEPAAETTEPPAPAHSTDERTPEQVRERMTAYREGWTRGGGRPAGRRSEDTPDFTPGGDRRAPGGNSEGDPA